MKIASRITSPLWIRSAIVTIVAATTTATLAGCSSGSTPATTSTATSATATTSIANSPPSATPATSVGSRSYTSKNFLIPVTVDVPVPLNLAPVTDIPNFLTWEASPSEDKIRFMVPAVVYRAGATTPEPPPANYVTYLHEFTGATITDEKPITVGGLPATILTIIGKPDQALDGIFGCPAATSPIDDCYGPGSELEIRIAIVTVKTTTLLTWARVPNGPGNDPKFLADFQTMLTKLTFN